VALAQAVNCLAPLGGPSEDERDACGTCRACARIAAGRHPDVALVAPEEKRVITIDQIRELATRSGLRAYEAAAKVWILDPAHEMQEPAANAFLKTLEEPTAGSIFILVTTTFSGLLPTIRSRCQEIRFAPLSDGDVQDILERSGWSGDAAAMAAAAAGGSVERALAMDADDLRGGRDRLAEDVWGALGSLPDLLECAERLAKNAAGLEAALDTLAAFTRDAAMTKLGAACAPLLSGKRRAAVDRIIGEASLAAILRIHVAQRDAQQALGWHAQPRFAAERMLLSMRGAMGESEGMP
jgi:DNA polymerase-3 subunit delta'